MCNKDKDMAPKRDLVMSWIDYWADTYGQVMSHKFTIVIYATNEEVVTLSAQPPTLPSQGLSTSTTTASITRGVVSSSTHIGR
ncbi:unnamed protein product [Choristocarpus tenellus]